MEAPSVARGGPEPSAPADHPPEPVGSEAPAATPDASLSQSPLVARRPPWRRGVLLTSRSHLLLAAMALVWEPPWAIS
eukprot:11149609-Alexandrium_andersonii.AAC.1